jgi:hypothetical protein
MRGKGFDIGHARPAVAAVEPAERTPKRKADDAVTVWENLERSYTAVNQHVTDMKTACAAEDRAGWAKAKQATDAGLERLGRTVENALKVKDFATDGHVKEGLEGAAKTLSDAKELVKTAPAEPKARVPVLTCVDALLAVLPPEHHTGPADPRLRAVLAAYQEQHALARAQLA